MIALLSICSLIPATGLIHDGRRFDALSGGELHRLIQEGAVVVDHDNVPMELDYSNDSHAVSDLGRERRLRFTGLGKLGLEHHSKNGTPWYRLKHLEDRGETSHQHFDGLVAVGDFNVDMLAAHNRVRKFAGLRQLKWNPDLEALAQDRVHKLAHHGCHITHSPTASRWRKSGFYYIGENLYKVINMVPTGVDIVDAWYAEIEDYTYGRVGAQCTKDICSFRSSPPCTLGHFTQVMWADSAQLGCAKAECPNEDKRTFVAVCNYGEGGNIVGNFPFRPENANALGLVGEGCTVSYNSSDSEAMRRRARLNSTVPQEDGNASANTEAPAAEKASAWRAASPLLAALLSFALLSRL